MPTNGFDISVILPLLKQRIGWRDTPDFVNLISEDNKASLSGRYFQSFHAAVTLNNIKETLATAPADDAAFDTELSNLEDDAILAMLNNVFNKPQLIESGLLFKRWAENNLQTTPNNNKAVGYRITLSQKPCSLQINSVALRFTADATFSIYLFCDSKTVALKTKEVTVTGGDETVIDLTADNWIINSNSREYKDRNFYLVYFQQELGYARAVYEKVQCFNPALMYCTDSIEMASDSPGTFSKENRSFGGYQTYGMLPEISVYKDFTAQIKAQAHIFDDAIGKQLAIKVIEQILNSTASNKTQRITNEMLNSWITDLNIARPTEERPFMPGLKAQYEKEIKRLNEQFFPVAKPVSVSLCS